MAKIKVAVDIGHGVDTFPPGKGVYKNGVGYAEHSFNSKLGTALVKRLKALGFETIVYQKANAKDIGLTQRTNYYNAKKVDLVYSLHANANGSPSVNGRCAFYWHTSNKSKKLAQLVAANMIEAGYSTHGNGTHASERGSWTNLHICRETNMPSVLVENGFMTGDKDFDLVFGKDQAGYIEDLVNVHAAAITDYFGVKNIIKSPSNKPKPNKPVPPKKQEGLTLAEAKKLQKQIDELKKKLDGKIDTPEKTDVAKPWAAVDWKEATKNGYLDGRRPLDNVTRQELSIVINKLRDNFIGLIKK